MIVPIEGVIRSWVEEKDGKLLFYFWNFNGEEFVVEATPDPRVTSVELSNAVFIKGVKDE